MEEVSKVVAAQPTILQLRKINVTKLAKKVDFL